MTIGQTAIQIYADIAATAVPFAVVFSVCNLIVTSFLRAAFGGRLVF